MNHISSSSPSSSSSSEVSRAKKNNKNVREDVVKCCDKRRGGRKILKEKRHPVYRGVRQRNGCRWVCEIREPNKKTRIWLGTFSSPEMAARAHDVAALALRGDSAVLNFQESAYQLPRAQSSSVVDIQKAAFLAANFLHQESGQIDEAVSQKTSHVENHHQEVHRNSYCLFNNNNNVVDDVNNSGEEHANNKKYGIPYLDEEEIFDMPGLINNMAEGMLLTPPAMMKGFNWDDDDVHQDNIDLSLWTY